MLLLLFCSVLFESQLCLVTGFLVMLERQQSNSSGSQAQREGHQLMFERASSECLPCLTGTLISFFSFLSAQALHIEPLISKHETQTNLFALCFSLSRRSRSSPTRQSTTSVWQTCLSERSCHAAHNGGRWRATGRSRWRPRSTSGSTSASRSECVMMTEEMGAMKV